MKKQSKKQSVAAFVRSLPTTMAAVDVVKKAKAAGVKLSVAYVHSVRYAMRTVKKSVKKTRPAKRVVVFSVAPELGSTLLSLIRAEAVKMVQAEIERLNKTLR